MKMSKEVRQTIRDAVHRACGYDSFVLVMLEPPDFKTAHIVGREVLLPEMRAIGRMLTNGADVMENDEVVNE